MNKYLLWLLLGVLLAGCKGKKVSLSGEETVDIADFIEFFPEKKLPIEVSDSSLLRRTSDSLLISQKIFTSFIPDSVIVKEFGKNGRPRLYALGRARENNSDYYLFIKALLGNRRLGYLVCFDKNKKYAGSLVLVKPWPVYSFTSGTLDSKFQITIYHQKKKGATGSNYRREVYIHNSAAAGFTLILTEPNEEIIANVINPIDSFPRKNKFSGDYVRNKKNFVSVRDGKNNSEIQFFVHFENDNGACRGELKGRAKMIRSNVALYQESGNPCALQFTFSATRVSMEEKGGCGSYRGITCYFDGSFPKKKLPRPIPGKRIQ